MTAELQTIRHRAALVLSLSGAGSASLLQADIHAAVIETLSTAEGDRSINALVLTGLENFSPVEGKTAFSSGLSASSAEYLIDWIDAIAAFPKPVIAAIDGLVAGPGLSLALACDLVVASHSSRFLGSAANNLGAASWFIGRTLPHQFAMEMLLEKNPVAASRLHAFGLINRLVNDGTTRDHALEWASQLGISAGRIEGIKSLLRGARHNALSRQVTAERNAI